MTLVVAWLAVDNHGPTSMYVASDSRVSWPKLGKFDYGRKVFALKRSPDILAFCGDMLFPSMAISQIMEFADEGLLFPSNATSGQKAKAIAQKLRYQFLSYPKDVKEITADSLSIFHGSRDTTDNKRFHANLITWSKKFPWKAQSIPMPSKSGTLFVGGTGRPDFDSKYACYQDGPNKETSRNVFHCFYDALVNTTVDSVGGAPQVAGIIRKRYSPAFYQGLIYRRAKFFLGSKINELNNFDCIQWTNKNFEICDGVSGKRKPKAKSQKNPHMR